nr:YdbL family protein [Desulfobacula sp.]
MNTCHIWKPFSLLVLFLLLLSPCVSADAIKDRMIQRLPAIAELKTKGIIGEDNRGYLGFVTGNRVMEEVVVAENKDRRAVYEIFAKQQNTGLDVVESVQGARKAEKANPGEFYQNRDGQWVKK